MKPRPEPRASRPILRLPSFQGSDGSIPAARSTRARAIIGARISESSDLRPNLGFSFSGERTPSAGPQAAPGALPRPSAPPRPRVGHPRIRPQAAATVSRRTRLTRGPSTTGSKTRPGSVPTVSAGCRVRLNRSTPASPGGSPAPGSPPSLRRASHQPYEGNELARTVNPVRVRPLAALDQHTSPCAR